MNASADSSSQITCEATLPLRWQAEAGPNEPTLGLWRLANVALLRGLAMLESGPEPDREPDEHLAKALGRVEAKLDVTLALLARLVAQHAPPAAPTPVKFGVHGLEWRSDQALPTVGTTITLYLYLSPKLPEPLQLSARVVFSEPGRCVVEFRDRDPEFVEWMTRTLFRYHRRALQARFQD